MKQVVVIHGGDTFENYEAYLNWLKSFPMDLSWYRAGKIGWKKTLEKRLGDDYEVYLPEMPNETNAQYIEWKLWMDKVVSLLGDEVVLAGHSLGGSFLTKYLSENVLSKKINGVFLVSACFDKDTDGNGLHSFTIPEKLNLQTENVFLYHSKDDPVVPFSDLEEFKNKIPNAVARVFVDRKHFNGEEFPELVEDIKSIK
jgi:predicted alpha/beta hydrolase family esterase